jgi:hypothetical protein
LNRIGNHRRLSDDCDGDGRVTTISSFSVKSFHCLEFSSVDPDDTEGEAF